MKISKMFGMLSGLSGTMRFSNAKLSNQESVLEHIGCVGIICYLITSEMNKMTPGTIDPGPVLARAMAHDVEEVLMGDVPRVTKYSSERSREMFRELEEVMMSRLIGELEMQSGDLIQDHREAKRDSEGLIVELADILAVVYKIYEEAVMRGNMAMMSRATSCHEQLSGVSQKVSDSSWSEEVKAFLTDVIDQARAIVKSAQDSAGDDFFISEIGIGGDARR
jgi:5'-deoxynucleotidase YfbR-like HD superfamily hydrolase